MEAATRLHVSETLKEVIGRENPMPTAQMETIAALLVAAYRGIGYQWLPESAITDPRAAG